MIDGVNKFFLMWNDRGTTHFNGHKTLHDVVDNAIRIAVSIIPSRPIFDQKIAQFQMILDKIVKDRDRDDANDAAIEAYRTHRSGCGDCQGTDLTNEPYANCAEGKKLKEAMRAD